MAKIFFLKELKNEEELLNENEKTYFKFIRKIISYIKLKFNISNIEECNDDIICVLPYVLGRKNNVKKIINNILKNNIIKDIVISKKLEENNELNSFLQTKNINILTGRWLFKYLTYETLEYICKVKNVKIEEQEIFILVKDNSEINLQNIIMLAQKVKLLNIVTTDFNKFKKIEEFLYNNMGILIRIANNYRKTLAKAKIILNMDFSEDEINKYLIYKKAIIINLKNRIKIYSKSFNGINANYYKINYINNLEAYNSFDNNIIYESKIYKRDNFKNIRNIILSDNIKVTALIGENGIINEQEYIE